jgi:hypothetical protein
MSTALAFLQDVRVDPFAVIANTQPQHAPVVPDLCLDASCV